MRVLHDRRSIAMISLFLLTAGGAFAQCPSQARVGQNSSPTPQSNLERARGNGLARVVANPERVQARDRIFAANLMDQQERARYLEQLQALPTVQQRVAYRLQHQQAMHERARERGAKLASAPSPRRLERQEQDRQRDLDMARARTGDLARSE